MGNYDEIAKVIGPAIREPMREIIDEQTREVRGMIEAHERHDDTQFVKISDRQSRIEIKLSRWGGMAAILLLIVPIIWDLFKSYALKR